MTKQPIKNICLLLMLCGFLLGLAACTDSTEYAEVNNETGRWYSTAQINEGNILFQQFCAVCHGDQAQGLAEDWRVRDSEGNLPPPPLNGTAHAWHHPLAVLDQVIAEGGALYEGNMPGFSGQLDKEERHAVIAYFQSLWNDEIYQNWLRINDQQN